MYHDSYVMGKYYGNSLRNKTWQGEWCLKLEFIFVYIQFCSFPTKKEKNVDL